MVVPAAAGELSGAGVGPSVLAVSTGCEAKTKRSLPIWTG